MSRPQVIAAALASVVIAAGFGVAWLHHGRSALWRIVSEDCVPAAAAGRSSMCVAVTRDPSAPADFVVLKDRRGALQYLVMPARRVTGIEDPALLAPGAGDYLADAWRERRWMDVSRGAPVPREDVALALNSAWSRSQDQLHVHVSCVRADLRARLQALDASIGTAWTPLPGGWRGHPYLVRRIVADTLDGTGLVRELRRAHAGEMGRQAIAVVGARWQGRPSFWVLETHVDLADRWLGGVEGDVQDHACAVLAA
ncbi:MAG: CDP-diacylglycerol diphosphatase [Burkholderiaceae bacterium]